MWVLFLKFNAAMKLAMARSRWLWWRWVQCPISASSQIHWHNGNYRGSKSNNSRNFWLGSIELLPVPRTSLYSGATNFLSLHAFTFKFFTTIIALFKSAAFSLLIFIPSKSPCLLISVLSARVWVRGCCAVLISTNRAALELERFFPTLTSRPENGDHLFHTTAASLRIRWFVT